MNKCFLDTNFLIYLLDENNLYHKQAKKILDALVKQNIVCSISHQTLEEFVYVFGNLLQIKKEKNTYQLLKKALERLQNIPDLTIISAYDTLQATNQTILFMDQFNLKPHDAYMLVTMIDNSVTYLATFDKQLIRAAIALKLTVVS